MHIRLSALFILAGLVACGSNPKEADPIYEGSPSAQVSAQEIARWNAAYGWGDHADAGYLKQESDPQFAASAAASVTSGDLAHWNAAFAWGDHAQAGYLKTEIDPAFTASAAARVTSGDLANWNAAFAWGDHAQAGYLKTESDPAFAASAAAGITSGDLANWNAAFTWGDHAQAGYLKTESDPKIGALSAGSVPHWDGGQLTTGALFDDGSHVGVGTSAPKAALEVWAPIVYATPDQSQLGAGYSFQNGPDQPVSQTFTPAVDGALSAIAVNVSSGTPTLKVSVATLDGQVLATSKCPIVTTGVTNCRFAAPPALTAGTQYRFALTGDAAWNIQKQINDPYPRGVWDQSPGEDLFFITYMGLTAAPSPALQVGADSVNVRSLIHLQPGTAPPTPQAGDIFFEASSRKLKYFDGSSWVTL